MYYNYTPPPGAVTSEYGDARIGGMILDSATVLTVTHMTNGYPGMTFYRDNAVIGTRLADVDKRDDASYWTLKDPIPDDWVPKLVRPEMGMSVICHCEKGHVAAKILSIGGAGDPTFVIDLDPNGFSRPLSGSVVTLGDSIIGLAHARRGNQTVCLYPAERFPILGDRVGRINRLAFRPSENSVFAVGVTSGRAIKGEIRILDNIDFGWLVSPGNLQVVVNGNAVYWIGRYAAYDNLKIEWDGVGYIWTENGATAFNYDAKTNEPMRSIINLDRWDSNHAQGLTVEFEDAEPPVVPQVIDPKAAAFAEFEKAVVKLKTAVLGGGKEAV